MLEYLDYSLRDFLPFSQSTWFRFIELYNQNFWPTQILDILLSFALFWLLYMHQDRQRWIWGILAAGWGWCGYAYYLNAYSTINVAAAYLGYLFFLQAGLITLFGLMTAQLRIIKNRNFLWWAGFFMVLYSLIIHPLTTMFLGGTHHHAEFFGLMPAPTLLVTFGLLTMSTGWARWQLLPVPLVMAFINGNTSWVMGNYASSTGLASTVIFCLLFMLTGTLLSCLQKQT